MAEEDDRDAGLIRCDQAIERPEVAHGFPPAVLVGEMSEIGGIRAWPVAIRSATQSPQFGPFAVSANPAVCEGSVDAETGQRRICRLGRPTSVPSLGPPFATVRNSPSPISETGSTGRRDRFVCERLPPR